jgi:hypothetical protein
MTILDGFLILIGITIVLLCAMEGLLRSFILLLSFYFIVSGAGAMTLATNAFRNAIVAISRAGGGTGVPNLTIAKTIAFAGVAFPLFILAYILSRMVFPETELPKLKVFDNILGLLVGVILALIVMGVIYGTWGTAVSVQWGNRQAWNTMKVAHVYARLRPMMQQVLAYFRPILLLFRFTQYPPFFFAN